MQYMVEFFAYAVEYSTDFYALIKCIKDSIKDMLGG